jgi:heme-degrading monooxygenase HmoA
MRRTSSTSGSPLSSQVSVKSSVSVCDPRVTETAPVIVQPISARISRRSSVTDSVPGYTSTPGNLGVYMLRRITDAGCEFVMVSLWSSMDDVRAFAGDDVERAVFYPRGRQIPRRAGSPGSALRGRGASRRRR